MELLAVFFVQSTYATPLVTASRVLKPDSAVPADAMSEEQTFRSEPSLSLRLIRLRRKWVAPSEWTSIIRWFKMKSKTYNGEVRSSEKDFETLQLGAFATPGLLLAQGPVGLTAESGLKGHASLI